MLNYENTCFKIHSLHIQSVLQLRYMSWFGVTGDILLRWLGEWRSDVWCAGSVLEMSLGPSRLVGQVPVTCGIDSIRIQKGQKTNAGCVGSSFCIPLPRP